MSKRLNRFLIVDLAEAASRQFSRVGRRLGYSTETAIDGDAFAAALDTFSPTVVLIDLQSAESDGMYHLKALRDSGSDAQVILTSDGDARGLETAKQLADFLGLSVVASPRSSIFVNVVRNELRKALQSHSDFTLADLRLALESGDIRPYYQPKAAYRARHGLPVSEVEAIPRWHVDENLIAMPEDFFWLAEDGGLLPAITSALLEQVVEQLGTWKSRRIALNVAVNLSASSLVDRSLPETLRALFDKANVEPSSLTLEVSEANAMNYSSSAIEVLGRLKDMGCLLAIDEFGSSYSSLEQLHHLRFDELKIDPALIHECRNSSEARTIIEATVLVARKLGLSVCADGVESQRTLQYLGEIGCNKAQGNFISRPLCADKLENRLEEWSLRA